jgi:hypothetical protein
MGLARAVPSVFDEVPRALSGWCMDGSHVLYVLSSFPVTRVGRLG